MKTTRSVFFKTTIGSLGRATLTQGPKAGVYRNGDLIVYEVKNVPGEMSEHEVWRLFDGTAPIAGQIFDINQLGLGKIAKGIDAKEAQE